MSKARRAVSKSLATSIVTQVVNLALVIIVSQLLPPQEVGSYVLAFGIATFLEPLREFQIRSYIIVAEEITPALLAPVRFFALVSTFGIFLVSMAVAVFLWRFFEDPGAGNCMIILALASLFRPFSQPVEAVLQHDLRYDAIATMRISGTLLNAASALSLLFIGFGIESLAWGAVVRSGVELIAIPMVRSELRLGPISMKGLQRVWVFCSQMSGVQVLSRSIASVEAIAIGFFLGLSATAFYSRGNRLIRAVRTGVEEALLPIALTEFSQKGADRKLVGMAFLRAIGRLTGAMWPLFIFLALYAQVIVLLLFGPQWERSVLITQILAAAAIIYMLTALCQQAHASVGETKLLFKRESWISPLRFIIVLIAVQFSIEAVAIGIVVVTLVSTSVNISMISRSFEVSLIDLFRAVSSSILLTILIAIALTVADRFLLSGLPGALRLLCAGMIAFPLWLSLVFLLGHVLKTDLTALIKRVSNA